LAGLADWSSRPESSPTQTSPEVEAAICELRRAHRRDDERMNQAPRLAADPPYLIAHESTFTVRFALASSDIESADNVDVFVDLPDGTSWSLTIFTIDEVKRLLHKWQESGEHAYGSYFWAADQLIVPQPGVTAMLAAIRELVYTNDVTKVGIQVDHTSTHDATANRQTRNGLP
jgi:hypothetical protein